MKSTHNILGPIVIALAVLGCQQEPIIGPPLDKPGPGALETAHPVPPIGDGFEPSWTAVARLFAPWIYQSYGGEEDLLTRFTFDGDWNALNNWENTFSYPKLGEVYVSMSEDLNRYFIYYGTFHPRDWCSSIFSSPECFFGIPWPFEDPQHENDLEGAMVVVDKRFANGAYPFGQVITIETVYHTEYRTYRNCSLEPPGFEYVIPDPAFKSGFNGCATFDLPPIAVPYTTTPSASKRWSLKIQNEGHGNTVGPAGQIFQARLYYPTDNLAQQPDIVQGGAYRLIWLNGVELSGPFPSLWQRRDLALVNGVSKPFVNIAAPIGPHDVLHWYRFGGDDHEPNRADAPWGYKADDIAAVHRGDWHNHPAWAWTRHYMLSDPQYSAYYEYCRTDSCRLLNTYVDNIYWESGFVGGGISEGGPPPCSDPTCLEPSAPSQGRPMRPSPPSIKFDFDNAGTVSVLGSNVEHRTTRVPDAEWGYAGGETSVLEVVGTGVVTIEFPIRADGELMDQAVSRIRYVGRRVPPGAIALAWNDPLGARTRARPAVEKVRHGDWSVMHLDLRQDSEWKSARELRTVALQLDLGPTTTTVQIDFVIIAP